MNELEFGPVELVLAAFPGDSPDKSVLDALVDLAAADTIRLIDLVCVNRDADGNATFIEIEDTDFELPGFELAARGLAAHEDVVEMGSQLAPGTSALLLAVELLWAKNLASRLFEADGFVVDAVRIPAPVVNHALSAADALEILEEGH